MPVWAAILVALSSGGFGAWLGTWNDRHERFRDRMIDEAADFCTAASEAFVALRRAAASVQANDVLKEELIGTTWAARDEMLVRSARLELLFGPGTPSTLAATGTMSEIAKGCHSLETSDVDAAGQALIDGPECLRSFQRHAFAGIRDAAPPSATIRESVRRALKR